VSGPGPRCTRTRHTHMHTHTHTHAHTRTPTPSRAHLAPAARAALGHDGLVAPVARCHHERGRRPEAAALAHDLALVQAQRIQVDAAPDVCRVCVGGGGVLEGSRVVARACRERRRHSSAVSAHLGEQCAGHGRTPSPRLRFKAVRSNTHTHTPTHTLKHTRAHTPTHTHTHLNSSLLLKPSGKM
jgi:hypothetical protein